MSDQALFISTLYADICDSVGLYESVGDTEAHRLADRCMSILVEITQQYGGTLIRTQGDGVMSTFPSAEQACEAALEMQATHANGPISIKVGFNHGAAIPKDGDVYGDAVNLAARIMSLARAGEILTSEQTVSELSMDRQLSARLLDRTMVKGKAEPINIYAFVNDMDCNCTMFSTMGTLREVRELRKILTLEYQGQQQIIENQGARLTIGRADTCQVIIDSSYASRRHGIMESKNDGFLYTDQSTNGTYFRAADGAEHYLKRESVRLLGHGTLSLGVSHDKDDSQLIHYSIQERMKTAGSDCSEDREEPVRQTAI